MSEHRDAEGGLKRRLCKELVQHDLRIRVALELDDHTHTVAVGLVAQVADALEALILDLVCDIFEQLALVYLIRQLGNDYAGALFSAVLLKFGAGAHYYAALARFVSLSDAASAHDNASGREIRAGNVLHEVGNRRLGVFEQRDAGVYRLAEVVRRDIRRHADGNSGGAVDEKVREAARQHTRLLARFVEVRVPVHRLLVDVAEHLVRDAAHARLGVAVCRGWVAVHGAEVAVTVDKRRAHGEVLRKSDERVVNGNVAVGVVVTENVSDGGGALLVRIRVGEVTLVH